MNNSQLVFPDYLLLDLFKELRTAGMALTLEQYDLLRTAITQGYGLGGWEDFKRVCQLLWVKPSPNYDINIFNSAFDKYVEQHYQEVQEYLENIPKELKPPQETPPTKEEKSSSQPPSNLPQIPPRKWKSPSTEETGKEQVPVAVQIEPPSTRFKNIEKKFHLTPTDFPIQLQDIQNVWRLLKRSVRISSEYELNLDETLDLIEREGFFTDVVMRPVKIPQAQMLLLIDDSAAMIPFFPVLKPLIQAIEQNRITPAHIYRFTSYPGEYLYDWHRLNMAESLSNLLPKLHCNRTIAVIFSDAGAATATYSEERINGIRKFLVALSPNIRLLIWLNPLPPVRWQQTSAWIINAELNFQTRGTMLSYDSVSLKKITG